MNITVDDALAVLNDQLKPLEMQAEDLESKLAVTKETRKRLRAAIAALQGGKTGTAKKRCPKKIEVVDMMETYLQDNGGEMPAEDLKDLVSSKITDRNWSLSGLGLRFKEGLACSQFLVSSENVVSLREKSADAKVA